MQKTLLRYLHLTPDSDFPILEDLPAFKAIVIVEAVAEEMVMWETCRALVAAGCLYASTWGTQCDAWHEAIGDAYLEASNYEDVAPEKALTTSLHEDEELSEVFWFAKHRAVHAGELRATLILHIADAPRRDELEAAWRDA
ncbi:DUF7684 family protein [Janthinobacterium psychrotolerans]|uniref:DUF7684 domain-containing protein n=1 Tax=Janthinobacterium psychrotolerans TaxID=1747903 RepID=A0A1A7BXJ3_9BURK|nr:hypothetical protein [Janthinobacterium psychrotolerans]OBV38326.1 hypothetical protein ASR47_1005281 [Janthinobacterium psychrotolerans]